MDFDIAHSHLAKHLQLNPGKFYSEGRHLSLGVGQLYSEIPFPIFDEQRQIFETAVGVVYVLTHECDIDQGNQRPFNSYLLICPIIDFRDFVAEFQPLFSEKDFISFLARVARREVSRLIYLPPYSQSLPYGGLLYLNRISHTHVTVFKSKDARRICTVTNYGLYELDNALKNHLLRPKDEVLAL